MAAMYPIAVGIDAMNGMVAVEGWAEVSTMKATDFANVSLQMQVFKLLFVLTFQKMECFVE